MIPDIRDKSAVSSYFYAVYGPLLSRISLLFVYVIRSTFNLMKYNYNKPLRNYSIIYPLIKKNDN